MDFSLTPHQIDKRCLLCLVLIFSTFKSSLSISFNDETTGVLFSPYVKDTENGLLADWHSYSLREVETMMEIVSTKFTKVITFGSGGDEVRYERNSTYFKSNGQLWSAEAAARVNKDKKKLAVTLIVGVWLGNTPIQSDNEFNLALESVEKANSIFDGTVQGVLITQNDLDWSASRAEETNTYLEILRRYLKQNNLTLKVGTRQRCNGIGEKNMNDQTELVRERRKEIIQSDFIVCTAFPDQNFEFGVDSAFNIIKGRLLQWRSELHSVNPNIQIMAETGWPSDGATKTWETVENLKAFWKVADEFGKLNNFTMWMTEAFDNPWKTWRPNARYFGWWALEPNGNAAEREDYIEKINEGKAFNPFEFVARPGVLLGIGLTILLVILVGVMVMLFLRVRGLEQVISTKEIKEFKYGMEYSAVQEGSDDATLHLVKNPYDKSHEFSKHQITIKRDEMLGSGQFGCVFLAILERDEGSCEKVALKMGKEPSPKSVLMSILSEIKILSYLGKNENIVGICGAYTAELSKGIAYLATEFCELGSLQNYLRKSVKSATDGFENGYLNPAYLMEQGESQRNVTNSDMIRWSREIACGMEYLGLKGVVHADMATRNVLLDEDKTAKITDFGLSRKLYDYTNYVKKNQEPLPWRWMAVESLKKLEFSAKSDVWSFGVTLWEIFSFGDNPYPGLSWNVEFVDRLVNGLRMKSPSHATPEVYEIMMKCWNIEANERPSFTSLKTLFGDLAESDYSVL